MHLNYEQDGNNQAFFDNVKALIDHEARRHKAYSKTVELADAMAVHVYGKKPTEILERYRPNEPETVRKYRLEIFKPITKSLTEKITNTVSKVVNDRYFKIQFPEEGLNNYNEKEQPEKYFFEQYPIYQSVMTWVRETFIDKDFADPNALILIKPKYFDIDQTEMFDPMPYFYTSDEVIDYKAGEFYLTYKGEKEKGRATEGKICFINREVLVHAEYKEGEIVNVEEFFHDFGFVPAFFAGGQYVDKGKVGFFKSFIDGVRPHWDKVIELSSDKDGSIVNHLYPERWEYQIECENSGCRSGKVNKAEELRKMGVPVPKGTTSVEEMNCPKCSGTGYITNRTPYGAISVSASALNPEQTAPIPPANYITKDIAPIDKLEQIINDEKLNGFKAVNMEVIAKVGDNQSGVAKALDRSDLDAFLHRIASHIFDYVLPQVFCYSIIWRYSGQYGVDQLLDYCSEISISKPLEFNVLTLDNLIEEFNAAKNSGSTANHMKNVEAEIVQIKFSGNQKELKKNLAIVYLRPFPNKTIDDLMSENAIGAVRKKDIILNSNVEQLVEIAIEESDNFLELTRNEQRAKLYEIIEREYMTEPQNGAPAAIIQSTE